MSCKWAFVPSAAVGIMSVLAAPASAATLFLTDVSPSANMTVTFPGRSAETTSYVGHVNWTFDRANPDNALLDTLVSGSTLTTFCIEGTQDVSIGQNSTYSSILSDLASAPQDNVGSIYQMGGHAVTLAKFWDAHYGDSMVSGINAAAFQLGVWEIVYDGGILPDFSGGQFLASAVAGDATSIGALAQAQSWLTGLPNAVLSAHYQLYVLSDPRLQDQLFGVRAVPLPAALPAGLSLLAGIAVLRRLRRRS
jgi:hypothetical protein